MFGGSLISKGGPSLVFSNHLAITRTRFVLDGDVSVGKLQELFDRDSELAARELANAVVEEIEKAANSFQSYRKRACEKQSSVGTI